MKISIKERFKGLLVIIGLASVWASLVSFVMVFSGPVEGSFAEKVLTAIILGPMMGGSLALVVHSFLRKVLEWIGGLGAFAAIAVVVAVKIPYYFLAWPGIKIGELLGVVTFVPVGADPHGVRQPASPAAVANCPYEGTVYTNEGYPRLLYRIRPDWKVDTEREPEWGFIDASGQIRRRPGPIRVGPPASPYETGYEPAASWVTTSDGVHVRVEGDFCFNGAYGSELLGHLHRGDRALL